MQRIFTGTQVRGAETPWLEAGYGQVLMRRAARGLAQQTLALLQQRGGVYGRCVVGLVGKGNNGGDTLWALSFLAARGVAIRAVPCNTTPDELHPEGFAAFQRAGGRVVTAIDPATDVVIDGVFGTGFSGSFDLPEYLTDQDLSIPASAAILACDIPSGVLADTGDIPGRALTADITVTFGAAKIGVLASDGGQHSGDVHVVDIGIDNELQAVHNPWWLAEAEDIRRFYGAPSWNAHKYSRGVLSVVAGSPEYPGAAVLVVNAAEATGVGYISLVAEPPRGKSVSDKVLAANPQAVVENAVTEKATALVVGPGLGDSIRGQDVAATAVQTAFEQQLPVLVDASGMNMLDDWVLSQQLPAMVLTPHVGEMQRLTTRLAPDLQDTSAMEQAATFAQRFGVWVVLKSADTYVFSPTGLRSIHPAKTSELATAGTGDTLSGILGAGMAALNVDDEHFNQRLFETLSAGVRLHSLAGELAAADGGVVVSTLESYIRQAKQSLGV